MSVIDGGIIVAYLIAMLFLGWFIGRNNKSGEDYFAGGRSMPWYAIGFSVGATFISASTFVGGPGWAYYDGIVAAMVNFGIPLGVIYANYFIHPIIYHHKVTTIYEYQYQRFGTMTRMICSLAWVLSSLVWVGAMVYIPCLTMEAMTGIDFNVWIPIIVIASIIYTVAGGIKAVIWSDFMQTIILIVGVFICFGVAVNAMDMPFAEVMQISRDAGMLQSYDFSMDWNSLTFFCALVAGAYTWGDYFASDQSQIQRYITAKDMRTIKKTNILAIVIIQVLYWICHLLGVILNVFYTSNPITLDFANSNNVMIDFLLYYMPVGVKGIIVAAIFAAAMSSLDSSLNSISAIFVKDFYEPYITKKTDTPVKVSVITSFIAGLIVMVFVYLYLGETTASILLVAGELMAPACGVATAVALCCFYFPRVNDKAMFSSCAIGSVLTYILTPVFPMFYLWTWVFSSILMIVLACIFAETVCKSSKEEYDRTYRFTFMGARKELKGVTDDTGCSMEPMKFDRYAVVMIALFVIQVVILWVMQ